MNDNEKSTHQEIIDDLTRCRRELMQPEISHRNIANLINRGRAVAAIVTATHREEVIEARRQAVLWGLEDQQLNGKVKVKVKRLKK